MDNPGVYILGDFTISTNGTQTGEWVEDLEGALAALVSLRLSYGNGGGVIKAYIQTTADDGETVCDIACVVFGAAAEHRLLNFSALTPIGQYTPTDGTLADDTEKDGILGSKLRIKLVSSGTVYGGSTVLTARVNVR